MKNQWIRFYDPGVPPQIKIKEESIFNLLEKRAAATPLNTAFIGLEKTFSYRDFMQLTEIIASAFLSQNIKKGDRIAVLLPNIIQFPALFFACIKCGIIFVPVNPLLAPPEITAIIELSEAKVLIYLDLFTTQVNKLGKVNSVKLFVRTSITDFSSIKIKGLYPVLQLFKKRIKFVRKTRQISFKNFIKNKTQENITNSISKNDIAVLLCTGGTTGDPKLAILNNCNILSNATQMATWMPNVKEDDCGLAILPLFHSFGLTICLNASIVKKIPVILVPKYKTKSVIKLIKKHRVTLMPGVPIMFAAINRYLSKTQVKINTLKDCFSGGCELNSEILHEFERQTSAKLTEAYGLTEASPAVTANPLNGKRKQGSIGIPLPSTLVKIVNEENLESLSIGQIGEIAVKAPQIMQGYWRNDKETKKALINGWLLTGDMGRMDEEGYIFITGRRKEMIIWCGLKIYPPEVEKVLLKHPGVKEAGVCGIPDGFRGEKVKALVVLKNNVIHSEIELIDFCKKNLAQYKVPTKIEFVKSLPKNFLGKIAHRLLN